MDKKKMQQLIIAFPIILIGGLFAYYKYLFVPLNSRIKILGGELEKIKQEYIESERRAARLPQLQKEIQQLNREISETEKKLPASKDVPGLIRLLSKRMERHNIQWARIAPGQQAVKDYYVEHAYTIPITTTYHNLASFLSEIGQMERIFATRFNKLNILNSATEGVMVSGELTFLIYTSRG